MRTLLAALILAATAAAVRADEAKAPEGDLAKLQGAWKAMIGPNRDIPLTMEIQDRSLTLALPTPGGDLRVFKGEIRLDESKSPKQMDWVKMMSEGLELPDSLAIYELTGDELKIASSGPKKERPTRFAEEGPSRTVTFQRQKPDDRAKESAPDAQVKDEKAKEPQSSTRSLSPSPLTPEPHP
ncbi:MAG: TIGR03067 domain-containing protein [Isosphaeraceae bacterium]|nr:TIGR03067 domain-containing protein [Isosphaeraceae bacterium]